MRIATVCCGIVLLVATGRAQDSRPGPVRPADERVLVTLKNGETLTGVAPQGIKIERLVGGRFLPSKDVRELKAGIRVWYYRDLDGYLFLEHRQVASVEVLDRLTPEQSKELSDAMAAGRRGRDDARRAATLARRAAESRPTPEEGDEPAPKPEAPKPLSETDMAVLAQFPPEEGWTPEKFGELKRRSIVLHVYPNANEQAFLDGFETWRGAFERWSALEAAKEAAKEAPKSAPKPAPARDDAPPKPDVGGV